jgi:hypothetical protein
MKNVHAVVLGRLGGIKGGPKGGRARALKLSPERRERIARLAASARWSGRLPELLRPLFWEYPFEELRIPDHANEVIFKIICCGDLAQLMWLRRRIGDDTIRRWIIKRKGRGLTSAQMSPWVSRETVRRWFTKDPIARLWETR